MSMSVSLRLALSIGAPLTGLLILCAALPAMAQRKIVPPGVKTYGVRTAFGLSGHGTYSDSTFTLNGNEVSFPDTLDKDEKIASNGGLIATADWPIFGDLRAGARLSWINGEGTDTETGYSTWDLGAYSRYMLGFNGPMTGFVSGGLGLTRVSLDPEGRIGSFDANIDGFGYHLLVGSGMEFEINKSLSVVVQATFLWQTASVSAEDAGLEVEIDGGTLRRLLMSAGVGF